MTGDSSNEGIIQMAVSDIFNHIDNVSFVIVQILIYVLLHRINYNWCIFDIFFLSGKVKVIIIFLNKLKN